MKQLLTIALISVLFLFTVLSGINAQCDHDTIPPTVLIIDLSTAVLDESNTVKLYAVDFIYVKSDNCTPTDSLRFTFGPTDPENDNNYEEEYRSGTMIFDCFDAVSSPLLLTIYTWDLAGNYTYQTVDLTLVSTMTPGCEECENDNIAPEAEVVDIITWVLSPNTECTEIWASDFVISATDNCTADELIKHSFTQTFPWQDPSGGFLCCDCDDVMNSPISVEIYSFDKSGNYTQTTAQVNIQNPIGEDCTMDSITVKGTVLTLKGQPMEGAAVNLENDLGEILESSITNNAGEYSFFTNPTNKYLSVEYVDDSDPDLSILDLIAIHKFMLGLSSFSSVQMLAADINSDGRIRVNDLKTFRKIILGIVDAESHIDKDWHFVEQEAGFTESMEDYQITIDGSEGPTIIGYRMGDVK